MAAVVNGMSLSKLRAIWRIFLHFQRLRPTCHPPLRNHGTADHLHFHARCDGRRRGWTDPPAGRASGLMARRSRASIMLRPGDANEVVEAYRYVMKLRHKPAVLALSRQPLPTFDRTKYASAAGVARGAYVLADAPNQDPEVILIATGSELCLAVSAHETLFGARYPIARGLNAILGHFLRIKVQSTGIAYYRPRSRRVWPLSRPQHSAGSVTSAHRTL